MLYDWNQPSHPVVLSGLVETKRVCLRWIATRVLRSKTMPSLNVKRNRQHKFLRI